LSARPSRLGTLALRGILGADPSRISGRARLKAAIEARKLLIRLGDPAVRYRIGAGELLLPLSHELPLYRADHPLYGEAVGVIAARLRGPVVDVGANVGDTAAIVRAHAGVPILCVEGDDRFFAILRRNAARLHPPPQLEHAYVDAPALASVERARGTARLVAGDRTVRTRTLGAILDDHPGFAAPALVKLDTDGLDVPILLAELELLARLRPALFFEYDPHLGADPVVFERLREIGYRDVHVYENTGELARRTTLDDDIHSAYAGHGGARYADLLVLP
jgi:FkbM family methyltransferase